MRMNLTPIDLRNPILRDQEDDTGDNETRDDDDAEWRGRQTRPDYHPSHSYWRHAANITSSASNNS